MTEELLRWQECDEKDQPTPVVVLLCGRCTKRLIEPHPRLYRQLPAKGPLPGGMPICADCRHRKELTCRHPDLKANGGAGLHITVPEPMRGFWDGTDPKTGRRTGGAFTEYPHHPRLCAGRQPHDTTP